VVRGAAGYSAVTDQNRHQYAAAGEKDVGWVASEKVVGEEGAGKVPNVDGGFRFEEYLVQTQDHEVVMAWDDLVPRLASRVEPGGEVAVTHGVAFLEDC
jgi:hypothetical protein